jgi:CHAT domain-containing protein/tetratricopeptide (TPR) repeat protein
MVRGAIVGLTLMGAGLVGAADDPPKPLTAQERTELEAKCNELFRAGLRFNEAGKRAEAADAAQQALAIARRLYPKQDNLAVAQLLCFLGMALVEQKKHAEAEPVLREEVEMLRRLFPKQDHPALGTGLWYLGRALTGQAKYADAETHGREALQVQRRLYPKQDRADVASNLFYLASALEKQGKDAEAEAMEREALAMVRRLYAQKDHPDVALSLHRLAFVLEKQGKDAEAEALDREALAMRRRLYPKQDHPDVVASLQHLTIVLGKQAKYAEAEESARAALEMLRRLYPRQDHPDVVASLQHLGRVLSAEAHYAESEALLREAVDVSRRLYPTADHPTLANTMTSLAVVLERQRKFTEAEHLDREVLAMWRRLYPKQDHPGVAASLSNVAMELREQEKYAQAEPLLREALAIIRRLYPRQDHRELAMALNNLAAVLDSLGQYEEAEALEREGLAICRRLYADRAHPDLTYCLAGLGVTLRGQAKYAEAEPLMREALTLARRLYPKQNHPYVAHELLNLAIALDLNGKAKEAGEHYREGLAMFRAVTEDYAASRLEGEALTFAARLPPARDEFLMLARYRGAEAAAVYPEVWASRSVVGRVYEQRALAARAAATEGRAAALLAQLAQTRRRRADLLLSPTPPDPASAEARDKLVAEYGRAIEALNRDLRPLLPAVARAEMLARAVPADLQKVLPAEAAVVDFLRACLKVKGTEQVFGYQAFVVTKDRIRWLDLGEAAPIEEAVAAWRTAITEGEAIAPEVPAKVRALIWAKVRAELPAQVKRVYVCPDMALCRVPWAALPGDKPGTILLEDYALATLPHAGFLLDKLLPGDAAPNRPTEVLAVGGVSYNAASAAAAASENVAASHRSPPPIKAGPQPGWAALPATAAEAQAVRSAAAKQKLICRLLEKEDATPAAVLAALPKARQAHLATHGFFADPSFRSAFQLAPDLFKQTTAGERVGAGALSPMVMTGLVFAGANHPKTPGRGIVTGEALVDLDLSGLDLAVLSACETGLGDVAGGEGTFGLQRAFHLAGARDVIASLWKVPDRPTAALMALFYTNLWDKDLPPVEALRQTQLDIYRHPDKIPELAEGFRGKFVEVPGTEGTPAKGGADGKAHPRLWAAFTLSGPGR